MAITINSTTFAKRHNSTAIPASFSHSYDVSLKGACSYNRPVFLLAEAAFLDNYVQWGNWYYFVDDVVVVRNNLLEVHCAIDVLATYKADILASTQYVAYSNVSGGTWLPDNRIPVLSEREVLVNSFSPSIFRPSGTYLLSVLGKDGCATYEVSLSQIANMLDEVENQADNIYQNLISQSLPADELLNEIIMNTDLLGNAYANAPQCLRALYWVPFIPAPDGVTSGPVYLGNFPAGFSATAQRVDPIAYSTTINIPWKYNDWRRVSCENISVYLPLVGTANIPSEAICNETSLYIEYTYTLSDGAIAYLISGSSSGDPISTYSAKCSISYPLGINQRASIGDLANVVLSGATKAASQGLFGTIPTVATGMSVVETTYQTLDKAFSTKPTCVGGMGGGAGSTFSKDIKIVNSIHPTKYDPGTMAATMGVPTMTPMQLSSCSGFCQCINAHVSAAAEVPVLNEIDVHLNNGFYIE